MRKFIYILPLLFLLIIACAKNNLQLDRAPLERVVYRDLSKKSFHEIKRFKTQIQPDKAEITKIEEKNDVYLPQAIIEFDNESSASYDTQALNDFLENVSADDNIIIIGHSHGNSQVGTLKLASKRATTIKNTIEGMGFKHVYEMASWGPNKIPFGPNRAVHIFSIKEIPDQTGQGTIPLVVAMIKEGNDHANVSGKINNSSVKDSDGSI